MPEPVSAPQHAHEIGVGRRQLRAPPRCEGIPRPFVLLPFSEFVDAVFTTQVKVRATAFRSTPKTPRRRCG